MRNELKSKDEKELENRDEVISGLKDKLTMMEKKQLEFRTQEERISILQKEILSY